MPAVCALESCGRPLAPHQVRRNGKFCCPAHGWKYLERFRPFCACGCGERLEARRRTGALFRCGHKPAPGPRRPRGPRPRLDDWRPPPELVDYLRGHTYAEAAVKFGFATRSALIGRMRRRGYYFGKRTFSQGNGAHAAP